MSWTRRCTRLCRQEEPGSSGCVGEREGRMRCGGRGSRAAGPGGGAGLRAVTPASDHRQAALCASWVSAQPDQEQGAAASALF